MSILNLFRDNEKLENENTKMRFGKKQVERRYNELNEKYVELLEWKSEQFDLYLDYQKRCEELTKEKRDLKRQLADTTEELKVQTDHVSILEGKLNKTKQKATKKVTNKNGKTTSKKSSK